MDAPTRRDQPPAEPNDDARAQPPAGGSGWLKHAFAVEPPGPAEPNDQQRQAIDRLAHAIARRHLTTPALVTLETMRPLTFVGSQALHFLAPFISTLTDSRAHHHIATFLERRGSVEYVCRRIEALEQEYTDRAADPKSD